MINTVIQDIRSQLAWPVQERTGNVGFFEIESSPHRKEHVIFWPASGSPAGQPRKIELAHELVHALFAEKVHHQFSAQRFRRGTPEEHIKIVGWACRSASDWLVDARLMQLAPDQEKAEIEEHLDIVYQAFRNGPPQEDLFFLLTGGLMIAQAIKYLDVKIKTGGQLAQVVGAFLSTPPDFPTVQALEELINKLLAAYTSLRVRLIDDGGLEVWEVYNK